MDELSRAMAGVAQSLGGKRANMQLCIQPSALPDVDDSEIEKNPVADALGELDSTYAVPESKLNPAGRAEAALYAQVKKLFPGTHGGNLVRSRRYGPQSNHSYMVDIEFGENSEGQPTERVRPPQADKDDVVDFQEFGGTHERFEPGTSTPSDHSKRCLECILQIQSQNVIRTTLQQLFKKDPFRRASGRLYCFVQYHFAGTCFAIMCDHKTLGGYTKAFRDSAMLRKLLVEAEILPFLLHLATIESPTHMDEGEQVPWQWYSVCTYALDILRMIILPARKLMCGRPKDEVDVAKRAALSLYKDGAVYWLMELLARRSTGLLDLSSAIALLHNICDAVEEALEDVLRSNGIYVFSRLFASSLLDRKVEVMEMDGTALQERFFLSLPIGSHGLVESGSLSANKRLDRARCHVAHIRQISGHMVIWLMAFSDVSRKYVLALPSPIATVRSAMALLRKPYCPDFCTGRSLAKAASSMLLQLLRKSHNMAHDLITNMDLKPLLLRWLLAPYRWPVEDLLHCIKEILKNQTRDCSCFTEIESFTPIVEACGMYLYSSDKDIQETALFIVLEICKLSPRSTHRLMAMDILSPKLYREKILPLAEQGPRGHKPVAPKKFPILEDMDKWERKDEEMERPLKSLNIPKGMNREAIRDAGEKEALAGKDSEAINWYTAALLAPGRHDENCVTTLSKRAEAYCRLKRWEKTVQDATRVLAFDFDDKFSLDVVVCLSRRAQAFQALGRIFEAHNDVLRLCFELPRDNNHQAFLAEIQQSWKRMCEREKEKLTKTSGQLAQKCTRCEKADMNMPRCARCKAPYCSVKCQRAHWSQHKLMCKSEAVEEKA